MKLATRRTALVAGLLCLSATIAAASTVPYTDTFDSGYTNGQPLRTASKGWFTSSDSAAARAGVGYTNSYGAVLPAAVLMSNSYATVGATNVWSDMYVKAAYFRDDARQNPTLDTNLTVQFYVNTNGYFVAGQKTGAVTNWLVLTNDVLSHAVTPVAEGDWVRIGVHHNYHTRRWGLMVNGAVLKESLTNINLSANYYKKLLAFNDPGTGGYSNYLDNVVVGVRPPADQAADADADGLRDAWELFYLGRIGTGYTSGQDSDGDGFTNGGESSGNTDPLNVNDFPILAVTLPYLDTFETHPRADINGRHGWVSTGPNMTVQGTVVYEGTNALRLGAGTLAMSNISGTGYTDVWADVVLKTGGITNSIKLNASATAEFRWTAPGTCGRTAAAPG